MRRITLDPAQLPLGRASEYCLGQSSQKTVERCGTVSELTRERIIENADRLFYEAGFEQTSFAMLAEAVGISRGNFHHHFEKKADILAAVIERRLAETTTMLARWRAAADSPAEQIGQFIDIVVTNQQDIMRFGCPVGSLNSELAKQEHPLLIESAAIFELFRAWLRDRFNELGLDSRADALALHLLAMSQGVAVLANTFKDPDFIAREANSMHEWLASVIDSETD